MNTDMTWRTHSTNPNETELIGEKLGRSLKGGEFIELISDLGGGKTTLVRGIAKGMGSIDKVASPTFTIRREYYTNDLTLYHFDFYRLHEAGNILHDLGEVINQPSAVVVAEWAEVVRGVMPSLRLNIQIKTSGQNTRELIFRSPKQLDYLIHGMK